MRVDKHDRPDLPRTDVSPWVGLVGLLTLVAWLCIARAWPQIVAATGIPSPEMRLSGPFSALFAMALAGCAMAAWSVFVDRVHRSPSTGLDWDNPRPLSEALETSVTKLAGLWITWAAIACFYCLGRWYWDGSYEFAMNVLAAVAAPLFVLSVPYVLWIDRRMIDPRDASWHFGALLIGREPCDMAEVKKHWRAWAIKGFFTAFMISALPSGFQSVVEADFGAIAGDPVRLAVFLFELLFTIDVQIGTVGYILTFRPLDAHIRSGNPYLAGWLAALVCYPPFAWGVLGNIINYEHGTADWAFWLQGHEVLLWAWGGWLVFLTAVYAWATVAFGIRFSNLTYRGVLTSGPYRFTRHPAYVSKNLFWWSSTLPFLVTNDSFTDMVRNTVFLACVSGIYYWRARTEEMHLLGEDAKYREYYDWMRDHGPITSRLHRLFNRVDPRRRVPLPEPAE